MPLINILVFFIVSFPIHLLSQDNAIHRIKGVVKDASDGQPIMDVMVFLKNYDHIGTFTNTNGEFTIAIPAHVQEDDLYFSVLGYTQEEVGINSISLDSTLVIYLKGMPILLQEVVVTAPRYDLEQICQKALQNMAKNYPDKDHLLEGFYRKVSTDSLQYTGLVEAFVRIKDSKYRKDHENIQIEVLQSRHGDNYLETDSIAMKVMKKMRERFNTPSYKSLHRFYLSDYIRWYNKPSTVFHNNGKTFFSNSLKTGIREEFKLKSISTVGADTISGY
jgi:CarboxypepD_reg-like domain